MTAELLHTAPDQHRHDPRTCELLPAALYLRLSDARNEKGSFVDRERALRERAARNGWCVVRVVIENDVISGDGTRSASASAFKRVRVRNADGTWKMQDGRYVMRVWRPGFQAILGDLSAGRVQALLTEALDRTMRDPRDLEDLIDTVEATGAHADSLSGSLKLTAGGTDSEIGTARVMVAMGNMSSRDTVRRVTDGRKRKADKGEYGGGKRPYGFGVQRVDAGVVPRVKDDGRPDIDYNAVVPAERDEIVRWAAQVLAGVPLRSVARDLITRGLPTVRGNPWTSGTVRDILLRPRNAAIMVHLGKEVGPAPWEAILPEDTWRAVVARLKDPAATVTWTTKKGTQRTVARGTNVGRAPTYLGTGLFLCHCGQPVSVQVSKVKARAYRCDVKGDGHVFRNVAKVEERVSNVIIQMLSRRAADPARAVPEDETQIDANALRAEVAVLRERRQVFIADEADGLITRQDRIFGVKRIDAKIAAIEAVLTANTAVDPAGPLDEAAASSDDPDERAARVRAVWEALPLGLKRKIIADRLTVTILPTSKGSRFDPTSVSIKARPST